MIIEWIGQLFRPNGSDAGSRTLSSASLHGGPQTVRRGLDSVVDPPDALHAELERARRYEHELSIVILSWTSDADRGAGRENGSSPYRGSGHPIGSGEASDSGEGSGFGRGNGSPHHPASPTSAGANGTPHHAGPPQVVSLLAAAILREAIRSSDVLCFQPAENRFALALTESGTDEARGALERIEVLFRERLSLGIEAGVARFPDDALTLDDLLQTAADRLSTEWPELVAPPLTNGNGRGHKIERTTSGSTDPVYSTPTGVKTDA